MKEISIKHDKRDQKDISFHLFTHSEMSRNSCLLSHVCLFPQETKVCFTFPLENHNLKNEMIGLIQGYVGVILLAGMLILRW